MRRLTISTVLVLGALGLSIAPVGSEVDGDHDPTPGGEVSDGVPEAVVIQHPDGGELASMSPGGSGGTWTCRYFPFLPGEIGDQGPDPGAPIVPEPGQYVALMCFDDAGVTVYTEALYFDPANPFGGIAAAERALAEARQRLDPPAPTLVLSPPASGFQLVGVPSWFWVDDPWVPSTASATLAGVTSTVTATPISVAWETGDETTFDCDGPGVAYDANRPAAGQHSDCTHTYIRSSRRAADGRYTVRATVTYTVVWEATTGAGGPLDDITRASTADVRVEEAQAVIE
jgi:hypothetical protein